MRRVILWAAIAAALTKPALFQVSMRWHDVAIVNSWGIAGAGESSDETIVDETAQSIRGRSGEAIPEITSVSMAYYLHLNHSQRDPARGDMLRFWGDTVDGRFHSNDTLYINGGHYRRRVTCSSDIEITGNPQFDEGWGYDAPVIFPERAEEVRENAGLWLGTQGPDSLIHMVLNGNMIFWRKCGLFEINGVDSIRCYPTTIAQGFLDQIPASGAVFVEGKLWVSAARGLGDIMDGEIPERTANISNPFVSIGFEGQLTIGCNDTIIISDNLVYRHARPDNSVPPSIDSCADVLGLVSERFIMIHRQVRDTMYVNAALAALRGAISVQDIYWYTPPGWLNPKLSLTIWGSLAQKYRGIIHTTYPCLTDSCERGFDERDYNYDVRLQANPPPHFPLAQSWYGLPADDTLQQ